MKTPVHFHAWILVSVKWTDRHSILVYPYSIAFCSLPGSHRLFNCFIYIHPFPLFFTSQLHIVPSQFCSSFVFPSLSVLLFRSNFCFCQPIQNGTSGFFLNLFGIHLFDFRFYQRGLDCFNCCLHSFCNFGNSPSNRLTA